MKNLMFKEIYLLTGYEFMYGAIDPINIGVKKLILKCKGFLRCSVKRTNNSYDVYYHGERHSPFFTKDYHQLSLLLLLVLELGVVFIQAFVFSLLTCVYINDALNLH